MTLFLLALAVLVAGGIAALLAGRRAEVASALGAGSAVLAGALGTVGAVTMLFGRAPTELAIPWGAPFGTLELQVDVLSAFFLLPTFIVPALAAIYGAGYMQAWRRERSLGPSWLAYNLLVASMALVLAAKGGLLFLVAWELMALASFFLVTFEHERLEVRRAGWIYLVATHLGTAALLAFFVLLSRGGALGDFRSPPGAGSAAAPGLLFVLAVIGFGTKAGLAPLHVWLPEAHPVAPSHVSAVMSGVMIKTGIYGILRVTMLLGPPAWWWAALLLGAGATTALVGVLFALAQHDLKRLLAYSSVENVGVITMGAGMGLLGVVAHSPAVAFFGFAAALVHTLNHSLFKALLFLVAGAVKHATETLALDRLGGLLRRMGDTGAAAAAGALAGSALPPMNGFAGELLLFAGGITALAKLPQVAAGPAAATLLALALVGVLAAAVFAKAFGTAFLGQPRSREASHAHEVASPMRVPMHLLMAACVVLGLLPIEALMLAARPAIALASPAGATLAEAVDAAMSLARWAGVAAAAVVALGLGVAGIRWLALRGRRVAAADTWACGYTEPLPRAQYTASSLVQPMVSFFRPVLTSTRSAVKPTGFHPSQASLRSDTPDVFRNRLWQPLFVRLGTWLERPRALQHGRTHLYLLYIFTTLLALLVAIRWAR